MAQLQDQPEPATSTAPPELPPSGPAQQPPSPPLPDLRAYQQARLAAGKATTINHTLDFVMAILHHLAEQGQPVDPTVFRLKPLPRPESLPRHLSEAEARQLPMDAHLGGLFRKWIRSRVFAISSVKHRKQRQKPDF